MEAARLVLYRRVSSAEQAGEGLSLDAQKVRLEAYAVAHDAEVVGVETDAGVSGKVPPERRPGLARALAAVRRGEGDGIAVIKLDRLSRSTRDVLDLVDDSRRHGWRLVSVSEHLDTATAAGRLVVTVLAALAQMEREQVGERTREALLQVARQGRVRSGRVPFGYRTRANPESVCAVAGDRSPLLEHEPEQRVLSRMLHLRAEGLGARRIARQLNDEGLGSPRTRRPWRPSAVQKILVTAARRANAA